MSDPYTAPRAHLTGLCVWCEDCSDDEPMCDARSGELGFTCTREQDHEGEHIACGHRKHDLRRWENDARIH